MRRGLSVSVVLCLSGAALVLLGLSRTWVVQEIAAVPPLPGRTVELTGTMLVPGARALGLVGLASVLALPATRTWGRLVVGALLTCAGAALGLLVLRALADSAPDTPWPGVTLLGAALLLGSGLLVLVRGRRWGALGTRFEPPSASGAARPRGEAADWDALDRGEDPTTRPPGN